MGKIAGVSGEIRRGMSEIGLGINELSHSIEEVSLSGINNVKNIEEIELLVGRFKLYNES